MERRKFLIGLGALSAGGAAAAGTGAFNVARTDRDMVVDTVEDSAGYLGLTAESEYAEINSDDQLEITFSSNGKGGGLNKDTNFVFTDVFKITNQGTDNIAVTLSEEPDGITWDTTYPRAYYSAEEIGTENDVAGDGEFTGGTAADGAVIEPGEDLYVHFEFVARDAEMGEDGRGTDTDVPDTVGVYAEATDSQGINQ